MLRVGDKLQLEAEIIEVSDKDNLYPYKVRLLDSRGLIYMEFYVGNHNITNRSRIVSPMPNDYPYQVGVEVRYIGNAFRHLRDRVGTISALNDSTYVWVMFEGLSFAELVHTSNLEVVE